MTELDIIIGIEEAELFINTAEELQQVKDLCYNFSYSQGFYGRLYNELKYITEDELPIII